MTIPDIRSLDPGTSVFGSEVERLTYHIISIHKIASVHQPEIFENGFI